MAAAKKPAKRPTKRPAKKPTKRPTKKPTKKPAKQPAKKPAKQPAKLVAKCVRYVTSQAEVQALPAAERRQFAVAVGGIVGGKTLAAIYKNLDAMLMGAFKLQLFRGRTHVYDVWINDVVDDGSVMLPGSAKHSGIGISQTRVYGHFAPREAECAAISQAIYRGGVKFPPLVDHDWS